MMQVENQCKKFWEIEVIGNVGVCLKRGDRATVVSVVGE